MEHPPSFWPLKEVTLMSFGRYSLKVLKLMSKTKRVLVCSWRLRVKIILM